MRKTTLMIAISLVLVASSVGAQDSQIDRHQIVDGRPVVLRVAPDELKPTASRRHVNWTDGMFATAAIQQQGQQSGSTRSWTRRHPVAVGFLIGAGAGAVLGAAQCGPGSSCDYGRAAGAVQGAVALGLPGALVGWVVSLALR